MWEKAYSLQVLGDDLLLSDAAKRHRWQFDDEATVLLPECRYCDALLTPMAVSMCKS
jgi:hypothetical protein